jgi:chemotaxis protein CheD
VSLREAVHTVNPGDVVLGGQGDRMVTLLGSCIAVVLTDPRRTVGAMCHIVHTGEVRSGKLVGGSHGSVASDLMFKILGDHGIDARQCHAYVYGGGNMFPALVTESHVGERNADWVRDELAACGIQVLHEDVGGAAYRRLSWTVGPQAPEVVAVTV